MSKKFKIVYIVLFMLICFTPMALMPFVKNNAEIEKRELAEFPKYMENGRLNVDFSTQFESWLNDRIPYRAQMLSAANYIKSETLHAPSSNVIVGKDGWLFYETEAADYMNTNALSEREVKATAVTISLIQDAVEKKGGKFVFVPMPNKASVYGNKMPSCYKEADQNNLTRVMEALKTEGVTYVNMKGLLSDHRDEGVYHRRDSHWNYRGALLGYNAMMDALHREHETYADAAETVKNDWRGDLDKLLYPAGGTMDDQVYYDYTMPNFVFNGRAASANPQAQLENFMSDKEQGDDQFEAVNREMNDGSKLYMVRDSFGRAVLPFIISAYQTSNFKRTDCPDVASLEDGTDVIYEIVERNLSRIIRKTPFQYAPERTGFSSKDCSPTEGADVRTKKEGYGLRVFGSLPTSSDIVNVRTYLVFEKDGEERCFEAFPIYDSELMGEEGSDGFSAILPTDTGMTGTWNLTILTNGRSYTGGTVNMD